MELWTTRSERCRTDRIERVFEAVPVGASGPLLVRGLDAAQLADVDDGDLIDVIRSWEQLASWVASKQLEAIAELARRRPRDLLDRPGRRVDSGHPGLPEVSEFAVDELAAALRLSRVAAGTRLQVAVELVRLPGTAAALRDGVLDLPKVRAVVEAVTHLDAATTRAVEERVLPGAGRQTVGQLLGSLSKAVLSSTRPARRFGTTERWPAAR